jgi:hypothetical protein
LTLLASTPFLTAICSKGVPAKIDLLTMVCCQPAIPPAALSPTFKRWRTSGR